jgi:hypothetical protein
MTPLDGQTYRNLLYLLLAFPLGVAYFASITAAVSTTLGLAVTLAGPVAFVATLLLALALTHLDTRLSGALLGADLASPEFPDSKSVLPFLRELVTSRDAWLGVCYLLWRFLLGMVAFVLLVTGLSLSVSLLAAPLAYGEFVVVNYQVGSWPVNTFPRSLLAAGVGLVVGFLTLLTGNALATVARAVPNLLFDSRDDDSQSRGAEPSTTGTPDTQSGPSE